jgi:hypothetical protein
LHVSFFTTLPQTRWPDPPIENKNEFFSTGIDPPAPAAISPAHRKVYQCAKIGSQQLCSRRSPSGSITACQLGRNFHASQGKLQPNPPSSWVPGPGAPRPGRFSRFGSALVSPPSSTLPPTHPAVVHLAAHPAHPASQPYTLPALLLSSNPTPHAPSPPSASRRRMQGDSHLPRRPT